MLILNGQDLASTYIGKSVSGGICVSACDPQRVSLKNIHNISFRTENS